MFQKVLYCVFPRRCDLCGSVIQINETRCEICNLNRRIPKSPCDKCGKDKDNCDCGDSHHTPEYERIVAPFYYDGNVIKGVHLFKFSGRKELADGMAHEMIDTIKREYNNVKFDFITYIPMSQKREKARGYNQSKVLAEKISKVLNVPIEDTFYKAYENPPQRNQNARQRRSNIFGAFDVKEGVDPTGKTYLVIDDVKTTGSTLSECAAVLDSYGALATYVATFAIR